MTRAEQRALEAYPRDDDKELNFRRANYRIAYERGYEQAEKDIKELMDKMAEIHDKWSEDSLKTDYNIRIDTANGSDTSLGYVFKGDNVVDQFTWEDMKRIIQIDEEMMDDQDPHPEWMEEQPFYEEMLRRFNKAKEEHNEQH